MSTQTSKIVYDLSQLIIQGDLAPDETVTEVQLAQKFSVSRTPVREALVMLSREGLLQKSSGRSYKVRRFSPQEVLDAIEVRGVLEGLAVRSLAEYKIGVRVARELNACLEQEAGFVDEMQTSGPSAKLIRQYYLINSRFHDIIVHGAQNEALSGALEVVNRIPFASVGSLARHKAVDSVADTRGELRYFIYGHMQHSEIVDAIRAGQGARAEALMRVHAQLGGRNIVVDPTAPLPELHDD